MELPSIKGSIPAIDEEADESDSSQSDTTSNLMLAAPSEGLTLLVPKTQSILSVATATTVCVNAGAETSTKNDNDASSSSHEDDEKIIEC